MATAQLPDGSTVELPDYASEATLSNLLSVMSGMSAEQQTSFSTLAGVIGAGNVASPNCFAIWEAVFTFE